MNLFNKVYLGWIAGACMLWLSACENKELSEPEVAFDKKAMLTHLADEVIVPAYLRLQTNTQQVRTVFDTFRQDKSNTNLSALKQAFKDMYVAWQAVKMYEFGPAGEVAFGESMNRFPADTAKIEQNMRQGSVNLQTAANLSARGLPAMEYVVYFYDNNLTGDGVNINQALDYFAVLLTDFQEQLNIVVAGWQGNYRNQFIEATGSDIGSSIGLLTNEMSRTIELIKNVKIGIPLGKKSLGTPKPHLIEAAYGQFSVELMEAQTKAIYDFYTGTDASGNNGLGFEDYLISLDAVAQGASLSQQISQTFNQALNQLAQIDEPYATAVENKHEEVENAYQTFQSTLVRLVKVDMSSAFGVQISYIDNDGD